MTNHVFELAPSGRAKCRSCSGAIEKGSLRFGERMPNLFGEGDMTHWHHPRCAAHRRPEALAEALDELDYPADDAAELAAHANRARDHKRLQRLGIAERASSSRARCRCCRELIEKGGWRLPLIFFEEGTYNRSGFIHLACAADYCETGDIAATIGCFAAGLDPAERADLEATIGS